MSAELIRVRDFPVEAAAQIAAIRPRTLALAGGASPRRVYEQLALAPLPWASTDIFFTDERCVSPTHPDSNYRMARESLLDRVPARVHPMPAPFCDPAGYERELRSVFGPDLPVFDLAVLGLGADGHTASLFPGDPALAECERWVLCVARPDYLRLTLTLPVLSAAHVALFLVSGRAKRDALRRLLNHEDIPATRVRAQRVLVVADAEAAP